MTTQVLVFESDATFAQELEVGLAEYDCQTTVVDDANAGLQAAANEKPDLILLSIELPRMNGFSVCNKLKRDTSLKEVPLIIMSSDSTEETFEQHRRLRTRAEDYVHKPISVSDLVAHIQELLPLESNTEGDESIIIDDDIEIEDADGLEEIDDDIEIEDAEVSSPTSGPVDQEVDDFTEQAFGALMGGGPLAPEPEMKPAAPVAQVSDLELEDEEEAAIASLSEAPLPVEEEAKAEPASVQPAQAAAPLAERVPDSGALDKAKRQSLELEEQLNDARDKISELESQLLTQKRADSEVIRLEKEVDELRRKLASGKSGGSAREFLDLREQLNSKDKEILEIRDQLNHREKELLQLRDAALGLEREKADLEDRTSDLERKVHELARSNDALKGDKEQASKRADDYKRKSDKLKADLDARAQQAEELANQHQEALAAQQAERSALAEQHQQALEQLRIQLDAGHAEALEAARTEARQAGMQEARQAAQQEQEALVRARETELKSEYDAKIAALHRANEESLSKLRAEQEQAAKEAGEAARQQLEAREQELANEHSARIQELTQQKNEAEATRDAKISSLEGELASVTLERDRAQTEAAEREQQIASLHSQQSELKKQVESLEAGAKDQKQRIADLDAALSEQNDEYAELASKLEAREGSIAALEADLAATRQRLNEASEGLDSERGKVERARQKWADDRASLERAKDALAAALVQLEETETRSID